MITLYNKKIIFSSLAQFLLYITKGIKFWLIYNNKNNTITWQGCHINNYYNLHHRLISKAENRRDYSTFGVLCQNETTVNEDINNNPRVLYKDSKLSI